MLLGISRYNVFRLKTIFVLHLFFVLKNNSKYTFWFGVNKLVAKSNVQHIFYLTVYNGGDRFGKWLPRIEYIIIFL